MFYKKDFYYFCVTIESSNLNFELKTYRHGNSV